MAESDVDTDVPVLRTERLILRSWRESDREPWAAMNADPEVTRYLLKRRSREESDEMIDRMRAGWVRRGYGQWAVERAADGAFLGATGLAWHDFEAPFTPVVEVGWRFAREAWGHGYATEAARATLQFGFETLGLTEIVSFTTVDNIRSRRVMERLGMTHDPAEDFDYPLFPPGHPVRPHVVYRLRREAWAAGGARPAG